MKLPALNDEEIGVGIFIQLPFYFILHFWALPLALISGLAWSYGGATDGRKFVRRIGVPVLSGITLLLATHSWIALLGIPGAVLACSLGYGKKSWLFCLFYNGKNQGIADYLTRLSTYILFWLSFGAALIFIKGV